MISFTNTIDIDRPAADVYGYLVDLEHVPEWNWAISDTTKLTPGPIDVGTRFRQTRTTPRHETEDLEITALRPHRHIKIQGTLAGFDARVVYDLDEDGAATTVTNTVVLDAQHIPRLASRLLETRIRQSVASNLGDLQSRLAASRP